MDIAQFHVRLKSTTHTRTTHQMAHTAPQRTDTLRACYLGGLVGDYVMWCNLDLRFQFSLFVP